MVTEISGLLQPGIDVLDQPAGLGKHDATNREVYRFIRAFWHLNGCSPTNLEIAAQLQISASYVGKILNALEKDGIIFRDKGVRAIRITQTPMEAIAELEKRTMDEIKKLKVLVGDLAHAVWILKPFAPKNFVATDSLLHRARQVVDPNYKESPPAMKNDPLEAAYAEWEGIYLEMIERRISELGYPKPTDKRKVTKLAERISPYDWKKLDLKGKNHARSFAVQMIAKFPQQ